MEKSRFLSDPNIELVAIKTEQIAQLKQQLQSQAVQLEQINQDAANKKMDRDYLRQSILDDPLKQGLSPLIFLNDQTREEFWRMLDSLKDSVSEDSQSKKVAQIREVEKLKS